MKHWFKDQHFRSLLKNSSYLGVSKVVAAVAGLRPSPSPAAASALLLFGTLILITSYAKAVERDRQVPVVAADRPLRRTRRWRTGEPERFQGRHRLRLRARCRERHRRDDRWRVRSCRSLATWVGIDRDISGSAMLYCTLLPIMGAATPDGVLRVLDRFDLISWQARSTPIARAILAGIAFAIGRAASRPTSRSGSSPTSAATSIPGSSAGAS